MKHLHLVFERQSTAIYEFILYHVSKQYVYGDFPSQFYFLFLEQNIKWLQSFLSERKSFARMRKRSFFPHPSSSLDQIILWSCFGLTKGAVFAVSTG